jgi:hypothetical protein
MINVVINVIIVVTVFPCLSIHFIKRTAPDPENIRKIDFQRNHMFSYGKFGYAF